MKELVEGRRARRRRRGAVGEEGVRGCLGILLASACYFRGFNILMCSVKYLRTTATRWMGYNSSFKKNDHGRRGG